MNAATRLYRWSALVWFALFALLVLSTASAQDEFVIGVLRTDDSLTLLFRDLPEGGVDPFDAQIAFVPSGGSPDFVISVWELLYESGIEPDYIEEPTCFHLTTESSSTPPPTSCGGIATQTGTLTADLRQDYLGIDLSASLLSYDVWIGFYDPSICAAGDNLCLFRIEIYLASANGNGDDYTPTPEGGSAIQPTPTDMPPTGGSEPELYQENGVLIPEGGDVSGSQRMGRSRVSLYAPGMARTSDLIVVRLEIDLTEVIDPVVTPPPVTLPPLPTPTTALQDQRYTDVFRIMGARLEGLDFDSFRFSPDPTEQVLRLSPGQTNFWEWRLRAVDASIDGERWLEAVIYVPRVLANGTIAQDEVYRADFSIEVIPVPAAVLNTNGTPPVEGAASEPVPTLGAVAPLNDPPAPAFSLVYNGADSLTFIAHRSIDVSELKLRTAKNEEWMPELFALFDVLAQLNNQTRPDMCLMFRAQDADDPPPLECNPQYTFVRKLANVDVFWYDDFARAPLTVTVYWGDHMLDICSPVAIQCEFVL